MVRAYLVLGGVLLVQATGAFADSITVEGKTYSDVYIIESDSRYYVQFPTDGRVESFSKGVVPKSAVSISADTAQRAVLLRDWKASRGKRQGRTETASPALDVVSSAESAHDGSSGALAAGVPAGNSKSSPVVLSLSRSASSRGSGNIARISLKEVPLRVALKAILRPMNLDYEVRDGYIYISSPERLRKEAFEELETRIYELKNAGAETLPKIVVQNGGGRQGASSFGGNQGQNGAGSGFNGGNTAASSAQGFSGTPGGGGFSNGGSAQFGNISQLFSTIDDRVVGEPPAVIGSQGLRAGRASTGGAPNAGITGGGNAGNVGGANTTGGSTTGSGFTNISQLFSTIDDRAVGETPAYIGR